jgi:hypothetical protein
MKSLFLICTYITAVASSFSQDTHYWSSDYGPGGFFLPGSTLAYNGDSGVYFYNPALLSNSKSTGISANAVLYQYQRINIKDGAGRDLDLVSNRLATVPNMLAGNIYLTRKKISIAYALIHTPGIQYAATQRKDEKFQVLNDLYSPGTESFVGQYVITNRSSETRAQVASALRINKNITTGLMLEGNLYTQYYSENYIARVLVNPGVVDFQLVANDANYLADYQQYGLRIRSGWAYDFEKNHFGLTINFPLIGVGGNGTIVSDVLIENLVISPSTKASVIANTRQTGLKTKWKQPFSFGFGFMRDLHNAKLYLAAEYFTKISEYNILTPRNDYFVRPDTGVNNLFTIDLLKLKDVRKPVFNFSVAGEFRVSKMITGTVSARTDFSYYDRDKFKDNSGAVPYTAAWNNYHLQLGANKNSRKRSFRAGVVLRYGYTKNYEQPVNLDNPNEDNILLGDPALTSARHLSGGLLISYVQHL